MVKINIFEYFKIRPGICYIRLVLFKFFGWKMYFLKSSGTTPTVTSWMISKRHQNHLYFLGTFTLNN